MGASVPALLRRDQTPTANTPAPPFLGMLSLLEPKYRWQRKEGFAYGTEFLPLTASLTVTNQVGIQGDSDFITVFADAVVTATDNTTQLAFVPQLVIFQDASSGYQWFNIPLHFHEVYGTAENPGVFAIPRVARANTTVAFQHQNLEATNRNVRASLIGFKSFPNTDTRDPRWQTG